MTISLIDTANGVAAQPKQGLRPDTRSPDLVSLITELWEDSKRVNANRFRRQREELDFSLKHQHYEVEKTQNKSQKMVQPHTTKLFGLLRHKWSEASFQPVYIECRPQNPEQDDPQLAEDAKLAIESVTVNDPSKLYTRLRRRWIIGALSARSWVMAMDYDWGSGREIFRLVPPWHFHRAPGWQEIHDPTCPWVIEESHPRLQDAREMYGWMNVEHLQSDADVERSERGQRNDEDIPSDQETVTILKFWERRDESTQDVVTRYSECPMPGCGFRAAGHMETDTMCPHCMSAVLESREKTDTVPRFPDGRLVIVAPRSRVVTYDDDWPCPLRSFPYMELRAYEHPIDPSGISDTTLHWDNIVLLNMAKRFAWDQLRKGAGVFLFPETGLMNAQRQPFEYSDLHGQMAFWSDPVKAQNTRYFPGPMVNPGVVTIHNLIAQDFEAGAGTSDFGLTSEDSKDIPVGTIRTLERVGNIPVRDFLEILREEESIGFGVLLDMLVHTWGPERAVEYLGEEGYYKIKMLQQASLSSMRVVVHAAPNFSRMKAEEMDNTIRWAQLFQMNPALAVLVAQQNNIPISIVRQIAQAAPQIPYDPSRGPQPPQAILDRMNGRLGEMGGSRPPLNGGME